VTNLIYKRIIIKKGTGPFFYKREVMPEGKISIARLQKKKKGELDEKIK